MNGPTLEEIYARCERVGACRLWLGQVSSCGKRPQVYWRGEVIRLRPYVWRVSRGGIEIRTGFNVTTLSHCKNPLCLAERHVAALPHQKVCELAGKLGLYSSTYAKAARTAARRRRSKFGIEGARRMRAMSATGMSNGEISRIEGVPARQVWAIVTGRSWRDEAFAGSSIFNLHRSQRSPGGEGEQTYALHCG